MALQKNTVVSAADIRKELFAGDNVRTKSMDSAQEEFEKRTKKYAAKN